MRLGTLALTSALATAPGWALAQDTAAASFTGLGDLEGGNHHSKVLGMSGDGSTSVGLGSTAAGSRAFRWNDAEGMVDLGVGGKKKHRGSTANAVSFDGSLVVGTWFPDRLFFWRAGQGVAPLDGLEANSIRAHAISADGSVVVGEIRGKRGTPGAFRWSEEGGLVPIESLSGPDGDATAHGTSADGSVVVGWSSSDAGPQAFRWTAESGTTGLGELPGGEARSVAWGVSADGSTVVGTSGSGLGQEAFRWTAKEGMVGLGSLPGYAIHAVALATSGDGSVIVGTSGLGDDDRLAFVWDKKTGMRNLRDVLAAAGAPVGRWVLHEAVAVSDDGRTIVGNGKSSTGQVEAWRAVLPD